MDSDTRGLFLLIAIPLSIVAGIHWVLIRFAHWSLSVALAVIVSLAFSAVFVGYANATPNGGDRKIPGIQYVLPAVIVFCIQLPIMWWWAVNTGGSFPKNAYWAVGILFAGLLLSLIGYKVYVILKDKAFYAKTFSKCQLKVESFDPDIKIQELGFESWIFNPIDFKRGTDSLLFGEVYAMPRFAETLRLRCQPTLDTIKIPIDYKLFNEVYAGLEIRYPETFLFRHWDVSSVWIIIEKGGIVKIFVDEILVNESKLSNHIVA